MIIGYARVSTLEQNEQLQTDPLTNAGCERLFVENASGAKAHRPELGYLLDVLREGDTLIVWKLDRLGRSVQNLVDLMSLLQSRGVGFKSLTGNMDTVTSGDVLVFNMFAAMAQFERDLIRERTNAGLQAAGARGHVGGRHSKLTEKQRTRIREMY
ncbi:recombinase family protein [Bifidobacterium psychraerophilum]|uniref:recombinase family protein n=1 Tax=Bifidobacterium psychraerophilum TaxID=218140 RepID=UPI0039E85B2B